MQQHAQAKQLTRALLAAALSFSASVAYGITPQSFSHTTEADFADGDAEGTVITNLGDIKLSSATTKLDGLPEDVTVIHDLVKIGGTIYLAAGPEAKILKLEGDKVEVVKAYEGEQVFALADYDGKLVIGVSSGENPRIDQLRKGEVKTLAKLPETKYVWDLVTQVTAKDKLQGLLIATGLEGKVFYLEDGKDEPTVLLDTPQANVLSLAADRAGNVYAGTDTDGLVYRIDKEGNPFVVYDAQEAEIAALVTMPDGMVYAGTAAVEEAKPGRLEQPATSEEGRPEAPKLDVPPKPEEFGPVAPAPQAPAKPDAGKPVAPAPAEADAPEPADADDDHPVAPAEGAPTKPTPEQYDALRQNLRARLQAARDSGKLDAKPDPGAAARPSSRPSRARPAAPDANKKGNAIYRIAPDGFVTEVFRESAVILAIAPQPDGKLIVATGNEGQVFSIDPAVRETTMLADLESNQVTCAVQTDAGLLLGAANPGAIIRMESATAKQGKYTSQVLDAGQVSIFGTFRITAELPEGTGVAVEMRSGNVGDPEQAAWSKWTDTVTLTHDKNANPLQPIEIKPDVPPARYLQYRLVLTGDGKHTPVVDQAELAYVAPNTAPTVAKLVVNTPKVGEPGSDPDPKVLIQWQANDDNQDRLLYSLEYKPGKAERYLTLAQDLTDTKYQWQTQHVPDGWYTLRLTADDKLDNPADSAKTGGRVSEPLLVDNTPPALEGLKASVKGGKVTLSATAKDELSSISSVAYSVDGSETYQASLPADMIYDSTSETWGVTISDLSPGGHVIAVRAIDARGNTAYKQLIVDVK